MEASSSNSASNVSGEKSVIKAPYSMVIEYTPSSPLLNKKFYEYVDTTKLYQLINSDLLIEIEDPVFNKSHPHEKDMLGAYAKKLDSKGCRQVQYKFSNNRVGYGRVYAEHSLSLGCMRRAIRHTLSNGYYVDIDIVNCHPNLENQIIKSNGFLFKELDKYVANPEEYRKLICDTFDTKRENAKLLPILQLYNGKFSNWLKKLPIENGEGATLSMDIPFVRQFYNEHAKPFEDGQARIVDEVVKRNPKFISTCKKGGRFDDDISRYEVRGATMSFLLQQYERLILEIIYQYMCENGYIQGNDCVLCYDGIMIPARFYKPELLDELHNLILETTGFDLQFVEKKMDEDLSEQIKDIVVGEEMEDKLALEAIMKYSPCLSKTSYDVAKLFVEDNNSDIVFETKWNGCIWNHKINNWVRPLDGDISGYFNSRVPEWLVPKIELATKYVERQIARVPVDREDDDDKTKKENEKIRKDLQKKLKSWTDLEREVKNETFAQKIYRSVHSNLTDTTKVRQFNMMNKHLLPILDGKVFNFKTLQVEDRTQEHLFTHECPVNYLPIPHGCDDDDILVMLSKAYPNAYKYFSSLASVKSVVENGASSSQSSSSSDIQDPLLLRNLLEIFGYYLTGETCMKQFYVITGKGNNGKSVLGQLIYTILGRPLSIVAPTRAFVESKAESVHTAELIPLGGGCRFSYIGELEGASLRMGIIKGLSGDNFIPIRACGGDQDEMEVITKILICSNHIPYMNVYDTASLNRLVGIPFNNVFEVDEAYKQDVLYKYRDEMFSFLAYGAYLFYKNGMRFTPTQVGTKVEINEDGIEVEVPIYTKWSPAIHKSTQQVIEANDYLIRFFKERFEAYIPDPESKQPALSTEDDFITAGYYVPQSVLYTEWQRYCGKNNNPYSSQKDPKHQFLADFKKRCYGNKEPVGEKKIGGRSGNKVRDIYLGFKVQDDGCMPN